ncbi:MAG: hypothetical protein JNM88_15820 [Chitinophagaceae bacterium]|nr:hypothetical protein [Chitinophagaceae bacterium]
MKAKKTSKKQKPAAYPPVHQEDPLLQEDHIIYQRKKEILSEKEKAEILLREANRIAGKSKTYTVAQSRKMIRRKP